MHVELTSERALNFVRAQPVSSVLLGTTKLEHLREMVANESIDRADADELRAAFRRHDHGWDGVI
jgi:aryl-alcohol dehydrogenase-like predicted oxidoreductase